VAGVELYNNTALQRKANDETDDATTCRIFEKLFENEEYSERTVAGVNSTTTQRRKDDRKNNNRK
jgi:hypothetical protein